MYIAACTDLGKVRDGNEDSLLVLGSEVIAVADGMGGHAAGEVASKQALETVKQRLVANTDRRYDDADWRQTLAAAVAAANHDVYELSKQAGYAGMGTTLTIVRMEKEKVAYAHVGDSRLYLYRDGKLQQITTDHSLVAEMLRNGYLTEAEAAHHPRRNVITRAVGTADEVKVDADIFAWRAGDALLLCTDGLTTMLDDRRIEALFARNLRQPEVLVRELIEGANAEGGKDNITVICAVNAGEQA